MYATFDNVRNALALAWKYKILWVFALVAAAGSFNSPNSGNNSNNNNTNDYREQKYPFDNNVQQTLDTSQIASVLGTSTSGYSFEQFIPNITIISFALLIAFASAAFVGIAVKNWAFGSLIYGTDVALNNRAISLKELSDRGVHSVWRLFKFQLLLFLITFGITLLLLVLTIITYAITGNWSSAGSILAIIFSVLIFILMIISMIYASIFSSRYIVLGDKKASDSIKLGIQTFFKNMGNSIKLSLANCLVQTVIGIGVIMVLVMLFAIGAGFFSNTTNEAVQATVGLILGVIIVPLVMAVIAAFMALTGYMATFQNITWTTLFNYIEGRTAKNE